MNRFLGNYVAWGNTDPDVTLKQSIPENLQPNYFSHENTNVAGGDAHREAENNHEFRVGATEATSSIQGFKLPGLTWVDSPGLHSVNEENGKLARDYVEHADLILYTMKSDSPGRGSDLAEIADLFHKDKKTLLLLTGSDDVEEDWDNQSNTLVQTPVMKSLQRRADQRQYVQAALKEVQGIDNKKLELISFSARYAQLHQNNTLAFQDSGMGELFSVIKQLAHANGVKIKQAVPMANLKNFIVSCQQDLTPCRQFFSAFDQSIQTLQRKLPQSVRVAVRESEMEIRAMVNEEFDTIRAMDDNQKQQAVQATQKSLDAQCNNLIQKGLTQVFSEIMVDFKKAAIQNYQSSNINLPNFELKTMDQQVAAGVSDNTKNRNSGVGALSGALTGAGIGSFFPVVGTIAGAAVGGFLGGLLGSASGRDTSVEYKTIQVAVGDNLAQIQHQITSLYIQSINEQMNIQAEKLLGNVLQQAKNLVNDLEQEIQIMENDLHSLIQQVESRLA